MVHILVIHGPNLNLLGEREPEIYGKLTLNDINEKIEKVAVENNVEVKIFQSNHEGEILDFLHANRNWADGIVINPAAFTHYSYAIRDAISAINLPTVEVHLSDIQNRELFRKTSVIKDVCLKQISGLGMDSYLKGISAITAHLKKSE